MENHEPNVKQAYSKMAQLCSRSEQCSADIRKKIIAYEIVDEIIEEIIEKLIKEKFIDDERYVRAYVNDKFKFNKWGKIKIHHHLRMKGLSNEVIQHGLDNINEDKYKMVLVKTMKDKAKSIKGKDKFTKMGQIIRYCQGRGFEPELIHRYMNLALENDK
jgi:regulatory protein